MLRVRPIHFTSRLDEWERLLTGLGMVKTVDEPTWREFDAGSGRLALHFVEQGSAEDGTTSLGVEVGDLKEFARRTKEAGAADSTTAGGTTAEVPGDLAAAIAAEPRAQAMFDVLTSVNRFALIYRTNGVKQAATREKKIAGFVEMLARHETPYPQKRRPPET